MSVCSRRCACSIPTPNEDIYRTSRPLSQELHQSRAQGPSLSADGLPAETVWCNPLFESIVQRPEERGRKQPQGKQMSIPHCTGAPTGTRQAMLPPALQSGRACCAPCSAAPTPPAGLTPSGRASSRTACPTHLQQHPVPLPHPSPLTAPLTPTAPGLAGDEITAPE